MVVYNAKEYNRQSFDLSEDGALEKGMNFIKMLVSDDSSRYWNDVHTYVDWNVLIVEWSQIACGHDSNYGKFQFVDSEEHVMREVQFPDGHYEYAETPNEEDELWEQWKKDNPEWKTNEYGIWYNEEENERLKKELGVGDNDGN